jgi:hypothetical protein
MRYLFNLDRFLGLKRGRLVVALLASTCLSCGMTAALAATSIVVDAVAPKLTLGEGSDDLVTLQNLFQSANMPNEPLAPGPINQVMKDLKMKRMRFLLEDVYCDIDQQTGEFGTNFNGSFTAGDCNPLGWRLQQALDNGVSPHVAVASFMPPSFAPLTQNNRGAETWSTDTQNKYKEYAKKLVRYIVTKSFDGGAPSVVFEISNEMDIADSAPENFINDPAKSAQFALKPLGPWGRWLWWIDSDSYLLHQWLPYQAQTYPYPAYGLAYLYGGDVRRMDRGISPVHKIFADAVDSVRQEIHNDPILSVKYAGKTIEMDGPALAGISFLFNPGLGIPTMEEVFLEQILNPATTLNSGTDKARFNSSLDRFSFHYYGTSDGAAPFSMLRQLVATAKQKLDDLGKSNVKLFVSEWGPAVLELNSPVDINYSHKGAAWAAAFLVEAVALKISMGSFLILDDYVTDPNIPPMLNQPSLLHKRVDYDGTVHYYPKPATNVFKMFARMKGERRPVTLSTTATSSNLGAFATSDPQGTSADIVVYNYNHALVFQNGNGSLQDTAEEFTVRFDNLPDGPVKVERYLVDADTSNLKAFIVDYDHNPDLYAVQTLYLQVNNGQLTLPSTELKLGVTHWRITRTGA